MCQIGNKKENAILHLIKQARLSVNMYFQLCFQLVREDKKKVISFASELKKLTSRGRSMATGGGLDGPGQSKDDRAACCVALTELQE